jgi:hypothetical protein
MTYPEIRDINERAQHRNAQANLSGLLVYGSRRFLQVLEGDRQGVTSTYHRILSDARHRDLLLIDVSEVAERHFANWAMRLIVVDRAHESMTSKALLTYGLLENFDPSVLPASRVVEFLQTLNG